MLKGDIMPQNQSDSGTTDPTVFGMGIAGGGVSGIILGAGTAAVLITYGVDPAAAWGGALPVGAVVGGLTAARFAYAEARTRTKAAAGPMELQDLEDQLPAYPGPPLPGT